MSRDKKPCRRDYREQLAELVGREEVADVLLELWLLAVDVGEFGDLCLEERSSTEQQLEEINLLELGAEARCVAKRMMKLHIPRLCAVWRIYEFAMHSSWRYFNGGVDPDEAILTAVRDSVDAAYVERIQMLSSCAVAQLRERNGDDDVRRSRSAEQELIFLHNGIFCEEEMFADLVKACALARRYGERAVACAELIDTAIDPEGPANQRAWGEYIIYRANGVETTMLPDVLGELLFNKIWISVMSKGAPLDVSQMNISWSTEEWPGIVEKYLPQFLERMDGVMIIIKALSDLMQAGESDDEE